jgi:prepilin peptidase CpaA
MIQIEVWMFSVILAVAAGWTDWRSRRIPNWLTVPGLLAGIVANTVFGGWPEARASLLGAGLGLGLLLPFVMIRSLGAGDWKLIGALGAWLGPSRLIAVLIVTVFVAAAMALVLIVWKKRVQQTARNLWHMLGSFLTFRLPGAEVTLDDPQAAKIPFGVAAAVAVVVCVVGHVLGWPR